MGKIRRLAYRESESQEILINVPLTVSGGATPVTTNVGFISTEGFNELSLIVKSSATHSGRFQIQWSFDGSSIYGFELATGTTGTFQYRQITVPVRAPYFKLYVENQDASIPVNVSAMYYMKN